MALHDWNHNGKDDMMDDYIEYSIYQETMNKKDSSQHSYSSGGCSRFTAFLIAISGLVIQALLYTILGIDVDNVPALIIWFLWFFFDGLVAVGLAKIGVL